VFQVIFWVGFVINAVAGLLMGVNFSFVPWKNYDLLAIFAQDLIFVSCGFLIDAFRLL
jgi:Mg2+ and Co2+ transporter CorA